MNLFGCCMYFQLLNRNAWLTLTAHRISHVSMKSVKIHAFLCLVVSERSAKLSDTEQFVFADLD